MALTLEQYTAIQPRILETQRLALFFAECGETKVARDLLAAATKASRLRPTKETPAEVPAAPAKTEKAR